MKQLIFAGITYEADRIVKGVDCISGYVDGVEVFAFRGVSDFSNFQINGEWDKPESSQEEVIASLQSENTELKLAIADLAEANEADKILMQLALAELAEIIAEG
ncbi:hypothetical protein J41TS12_17340 [Paenibacillus antibioticophila]|uniref:Uncharacterized protein n=1 Tax=Paenibacillus antibioticophila TaxID=1274374 RepID=A0A919XUX3_9BACL|nr:hypothetical protein [Paenibacillus antibioticophila]GIO36873.1 hypothetical protein J41TS12_17340 [Paenibacillus antibioticophila]